MTDASYLQSLQLIDIAANENRLYHYNGGQAYIRISMDCDALMIIDHTNFNKSNIQIVNGTGYFQDCANYNIEYSKRVRENGSILNWFLKHTQLHEKDRV